MKNLFMLAALFLLTGSVNAEPSSFTGQCQESYHNNSSLDNGASQTEIIFLYLSDNCLPEPAYDKDPQFYKLLQRTDGDQQIQTIEASLHRQKVFTC